MVSRGACIRLREVRQNNLKGFNLNVPLGKMTVVTGVSGSGKSSLVFDTLYAEGQRRYVETFSPYARQFLERLDQPRVAAIEGIPPAIAIQQGNTVKTSRSSVGTLTELCDYFKLLMPHRAVLLCPSCNQPVADDTPESVFRRLLPPRETPVALVFPVPIPARMEFAEVARLLIQQGYRRWWDGRGIRELEPPASGSEKLTGALLVVQDRLVLCPAQKGRFIEAAEAASRAGKGRYSVISLADGSERKFSRARHCATCNRSFREPGPGLFSFNNPLGACPKCRGFGRTIEIDMTRVLPNRAISLRAGVIRPWQSGVSAECQDDLLKYCRRRRIDLEIPFERLPVLHQNWILEGDPADPGHTGYGPWYGVSGYFRWLESKSYKMHMRVLLSRYRTYRTCDTCKGTRFQPETLAWRLAGKNLAQLYAMPIRELRDVIGGLLKGGGNSHFPTVQVMLSPVKPSHGSQRESGGGDDTQTVTDPTALVLHEIFTRLDLLGRVGLDYLTLDRSARTLSGGEVQRVNLTTCLGAAMVNTLFILDEPSVGLHPRDVERLVGVIHALRDRGNTLVVVEHEPSVIRAADWLVDLGPGAGEAGGRMVFCGRVPSRTATTSTSGLTLDYLSGRRGIALPAQRRVVVKSTPRLTVRDATENNLKHLSVEIPLERFVCVTGVSGSGKSTLIHHVLHKNLETIRGQGSGQPGRCAGIDGHEAVGEVILVDQSPIGRTSRSNPAVYVGAWDAIREMFGALEEAIRRGFTAGAFSFNAGEGRCPRCRGLGHETVEMQFLSDVLIRCPECRGRRFRPEILEIRLAEKNAADWLESTVTAALAQLDRAAKSPPGVPPQRWTRWHRDAVNRLRLLERVGLGYLRLGQPVNTLSGGEAQRLKLCGFLAGSSSSRAPTNGSSKPALLIFDEPTTGLHFDDVRQLIEVFQQLADSGHSILVIEHNMELVKCADWIIDLGPEAGDLGGELVACGPPESVAAQPASHTGRYLQPLLQPRCATKPKLSAPGGDGVLIGGGSTEIRVSGAREHNLKNLSIGIPRDKLVVITGLSGSGKSTLAFDLIFAEGQRRFLDCMSAYARQYVEQMTRPDVDRVEGVPPTVAIEQRVTRGGWKSTVATITEAYHFIRLLYAKVGVQHCPNCNLPIHEQSEDAAIEQAIAQARRRPLRLLAPVVRGRKGFHDEVIQWAAKQGIERLRVDGHLRNVAELAGGKKLARYAEHTIELDCGLLEKGGRDRERIRRALRFGQGMLWLADPRSTETQRTGAGIAISTARACPGCGQSFPPLDPKDFSFNSPSGWCPDCQGYGVIWSDAPTEALEGEEATERDQQIERRGAADAVGAHPCATCQGARLKAGALHVRVGGETLGALNAMSAATACRWFSALKFTGRDRALAHDVIPQIVERLKFMNEVGLDYLGLGRAAVTLSGGEAQRIRLASQLGSNLRGVLYVLDEPTIGLHPRDNERLLTVLQRLKARGNSLLIVEHDEETMRRADWLIDLGPGAGKHGGEVVWAGSPKISNCEPKISNSSSRTLDFLRNPLRHPIRGVRRSLDDVHWLTVKGAVLHNLKNVTARFPIGRLTVVTGVSGAGKSSLARGTLLQGLKDPRSPWRKCLRGIEFIAAAYEVDQSPIGKTPRSCPATYLGVWDEIRRLFAGTPDARIRGYTASRFSFNVGEGRCAKCVGHGRVTLQMNFLPDAQVPCEVCGGTRFNGETLEILYRKQSIAGVLGLTVEEAADFFSFDRRIAGPLRLLAETGMGYLALGQSSPTLSGGEAQRLKLVSELMRGHGVAAVQRNVYVLEEPTIGLHFADVEKLVGVLHRLVESGHTVIVIEHNLDVIAEADYVIDLGPEGGERGGRVVAAGTPEQIAVSKTSHTGRYLKPVLSR